MTTVVVKVNRFYWRFLMTWQNFSLLIKKIDFGAYNTKNLEETCYYENSDCLTFFYRVSQTVLLLEPFKIAIKHAMLFDQIGSRSSLDRKESFGRRVIMMMVMSMQQCLFLFDFIIVAVSVLIVPFFKAV